MVILFFSTSIRAQNKDSLEIKSVLDSQIIAWNNGSIEGFMEAYWKDSSLIFVTKKGSTYGWVKVRDMYYRSYSDLEQMGKLDFIIDKIRLLDSNNLYQVTGIWKVRPLIGDEKSGYFSLFLKKINGKWRIIADHTF